MPNLITEETIREVEQFLYREARLLDSRRFSEWLEFFSEDLRYWMPTRSNRYPVNSKAISILDASRYEEEEVSGEDELAFMEETKKTLEMRVARLGTGMAWAEDPPSRTRHIITNIEVEQGDTSDQLRAYSNFVMYRNRAERDEDFYVGSREDIMRREGGQLRISYRKIVMDQNVLLAKNISNFF
ncbi:MAG: 3-phenylpropionate/cinnamic acid dioxygenase subunit beta [Dehalococcoidia bacterium]|jgi:3-phenylpropionate/cinnamic acid dioxygenase small subunit|nr:3-phenylpropionate/cinnamic acid dioxygenase subunit beta [Dehalococcoidia bacterium]|tara:strand:+ start:27332 stop:27886 length:555 start_codon:yes stop_codon:yes gene_type:complete